MRFVVFIIVTVPLWFDDVSCKSVSGLYEPDDNVTILNQDNFEEIIFNSSVIWIVEFYSSWCGHCQEYAPLYKSFAKDIKDWQSIVRLAAINCPDNEDLCRKKEVKAYPELRVFYPFSNFSNPGKNIKAAQRVGDFREEMVRLAEKYLKRVGWKLRKPEPNFSFIKYNEIGNHVNNPDDQPYYLALVIESEESSIGQQIILDTSSCKNITVRRVQLDSNVAAKLSSNYQLTFTDYPHVIVLTRDGNVIEINVKLRERSFFTYQLEELPGVGDPKILPNQNSVAPEEESNYVDWTEVDQSHVYLADLESALRYSLAVEIPSAQILEGDVLYALKTYVSAFALLSENLPFRPSTKRFLVMLNAWLGGRVLVKYEVWKRRVEEINTNNYLVQTNKRWVGCAPSSPHLRGYPCSLWTLFHVLAVAGYVQENKEDFDVPDVEVVPRAMEAYITTFFGCRECSTNFAKEITSSPYKNTLKKHRDVVMWLWKLHNNVNNRLQGAVSEDPQFPKVQFPSAKACPYCRNSDRSWNEDEVFEFLAARYNPDNVSFKFLPDISDDNIETLENEDNMFLSEFDEDQPYELQIQHVEGKLEDDHDFNGRDTKDNDEEYEKIGEGNRYVGHPNLLQEREKDRVKSHPIDELKNFGGDGRRFHPRDISGRDWHNGYGPGSRLSNVDISMCFMLWGTSMFAVFFLYYFVKRRRKCNVS